ncbi:MAG: hypothetical protein DRP87_17070 [Spirochaetes bacterium]|nr:MAG: hypothetical protein DRP87_17070 [Spirochaetota bacterium]
MSFTSTHIDIFNKLDSGIKITDFSSEGDSGNLIIKLEGYLDTKNSIPFREAVTRALSENKKWSSVVIDLLHVSYISSTGIGSLANILVETKKAGKEMYLANVNNKVKSIMKMLGFYSYFKFLNH